MISLLFSGLLVAILTGRGIEPTEITEEPVSQENPDVYAKPTDESIQAHESSRAATVDPSPASLPPDEYYDTEYDDNGTAIISSSGGWEDEEDGSPSGVLLDSASNANQDSIDDAARNGRTPIAISVVFVILVLVVSVGIAILYHRRRKQKTIPSDIKEGVALAVSDPETPPTPLFEDDIPSVLELEVEDLQKLPEKTATMESTSDSGDDS